MKDYNFEYNNGILKLGADLIDAFRNEFGGEFYDPWIELNLKLSNKPTKLSRSEGIEFILNISECGTGINLIKTGANPEEIDDLKSALFNMRTKLISKKI